MALLDIDGLSVTAMLARSRVGVLQDVHVSVDAGRVVAVVGESGAGKSMITRAVAGLLPPGFGVSSGAVRFDGTDLARLGGRARRMLLGREIAFIPQQPMTALDPIMTIGRHFDRYLSHAGVAGRAARRDRALEAMEAVHLPRPADLLGSYAHELSGGMCQRVLIAMAFASRPRLIVADEPTTALDATIQARIVRLMADMQRDQGTALVFVTHDLRLASQIADETLVLYAGRVVERGPTRAVFGAARHPYTRSLLLANPPINGPDRPLLVMPDRMPGLAAVGSIRGCAFAPRCAVATPDCHETPVPAADGTAAHFTACLHPGRTSGIDPGPPAPRPQGGSTAPVLTVEGLSKTYARAGGLFSRGRSVTALNDVSLTLHEGEFLGVVGESGSGKSTLAKVLVGLEAPTSGRLRIGDLDLSRRARGDVAARARAIQMVFQDPQSALNPRRMVWQLVVQMLETLEPRLTNPERIARAQVLLTDMGLPRDAAFRYPGQLSGGQRQRVNIARALCVLPRVLVADEIVSGLDVSVQAQLLELLLGLRARHGFSMILISHDLSVVRHVCDRVVVMQGGRVVEEGPTRRVLDHPADPYTRRLIAAVPPDTPDMTWDALTEPDPDRQAAGA